MSTWKLCHGDNCSGSLVKVLFGRVVFSNYNICISGLIVRVKTYRPDRQKTIEILNINSNKSRRAQNKSVNAESAILIMHYTESRIGEGHPTHYH